MPSTQSKTYSIYFPSPAEFEAFMAKLLKIKADYQDQGWSVSLTRLAKHLLVQAAEREIARIDGHAEKHLTGLEVLRERFAGVLTGEISPVQAAMEGKL